MEKNYWQYFDLQCLRINLILRVNCTDSMFDKGKYAEKGLSRLFEVVLIYTLSCFWPSIPDKDWLKHNCSTPCWPKTFLSQSLHFFLLLLFNSLVIFFTFNSFGNNNNNDNNNNHHHHHFHHLHQHHQWKKNVPITDASRVRTFS